MKIKTITCHDVYNAGAGLQAYALMTYLQQLGHDVEIIDYKPNYLSSHYSFLTIGNPIYEKNMILKSMYLVAKFPGRLRAFWGKRKRNYDNFKRNYLRVTDKRYSSNEVLTKELPKADIYFAGSDQIWNPVFKNGRDPAFYLDFVPEDKVKVSYAASFAVESIPIELETTVKNKINKLDYISVREKSGLDILNKLGISRGEQVLDPVFLLKKEEWDKLCENENKTEKYLLVYDFDKSEEIKQLAKKIARARKYKIYSVFKSNYSDKSFQSSGPIEFLRLVRNAEFVISNSFHATAFSLIFQKQFVVVNRKEKINTRMHDLLSKVDLEERMINDTSQADCLSDILYDDINILLKQEIQQSKAYIQKVLAGVKESAE